MADSIKISGISPKRYYCFGNLPVHVTSFFLAIVLTVLWIVSLFLCLKHGDLRGENIFGFLFVLACLLALIYGNFSKKAVYYWPIIYFLRPLLLICMFGMIYDYTNRMPRTSPSSPKIILDILSDVSNLYAIAIVSILLYIFNIFAVDSIYVCEVANQPNFNFWTMLKKRIVQALS